MKAIWNGVVIAESNETERVEGNDYFPPESIKREYIEDSKTESVCPWKGLASYYSLNVNGEVNSDAAWYYPEPSIAAKKIKGYVAFWNGVTIEK